MKPLAIELFAGLHGWGEGAVEAGFRVVGFDLFDMCAIFKRPRPKGIEIVLQDVLTLHGSQFRDATLIVASPPCQKYSYLAMPWSRSKDPNNSKAAKELRRKWEAEGPDNRLFDACFRIQREAIEATRQPCPNCLRHPGKLWTARWEMCRRCQGSATVTRYIPLIVENVRGAQPWVGRSAWNYGSFHLWGDVPALMPFSQGRKLTGRNFHTHALTNGAVSSPSFHGGEHETRGVGLGVKVPGQVHGTEYAFTRTGANGQTVLGTREGQKVPVYSDPRRNGGKGVHLTSQQENADGTKQAAGNGDWFSKEARDGGASARFGSKSNARKMASAMIAKIPLELARHIAAVYKPR